MARKIRAWIFAALALLVLWFIFSNSGQSAPASHARSGWVADLLRPLLNPNGWIEEQLYLKLVRKLAHFVEFGALGTCLGGVACNISLRRKWYCAGLFGVAAACADETLQAFTGRTNSLKDVCIDSAGALCGLVFAWLILLLYRRITSWQS